MMPKDWIPASDFAFYMLSSLVQGYMQTFGTLALTYSQGLRCCFFPVLPFCLIYFAGPCTLNHSFIFLLRLSVCHLSHLWSLSLSLYLLFRVVYIESSWNTQFRLLHVRIYALPTARTPRA